MSGESKSCPFCGCERANAPGGCSDDLDFSLEATDVIDEVAEREHDRNNRAWKALKLLVRYINAGHLPEYATSHYYAAKALLREVEAPDDGASETAAPGAEREWFDHRDVRMCRCGNKAGVSRCIECL